MGSGFSSRTAAAGWESAGRLHEGWRRVCESSTFMKPRTAEVWSGALRQIPVQVRGWGVLRQSAGSGLLLLLLLLLAEQAEALLLVLLFVLLSLAGTWLSGECDGGRQCLSSPRCWRARGASLDVGAVGGSGGVQDGLDPGAHLLLQMQMFSENSDYVTHRGQQ